MKILLVSQYFWPETFLINDLVACLQAQGHSIEVLTGKPNYPEGRLFSGYLARGCVTEYFKETIPVHRVPMIPRGKGGGLRRILNYFSFVISGIVFAPRRIKNTDFDVILVYIPSPITAVIPAIFLKKKLKVPLAVWVQDLWPESVSATGYVKNKRLLAALQGLVRWIYAKSDCLLVQSRGFIEPVGCYAAAEKIIYYPNSYQDNAADCDPSLLPYNLLQVLQTYDCFVFAGNIGSAQSIETLVETAQRLAHIPRCKIVIVGSGSLSDWLIERVSTLQLDNVIVAGRFLPEVMPTIFHFATALLVTLKKELIFTYTIPSKIQAYLAAGKPIIAALHGEGAKVIVEAGAGFCGPAEDAAALAAHCEQVSHLSQAERDALGASARQYFLQHFEMGQQSKRLIEILQALLPNGQTKVAKNCSAGQTRKPSLD